MKTADCERQKIESVDLVAIVATVENCHTGPSLSSSLLNRTFCVLRSASEDESGQRKRSAIAVRPDETCSSDEQRNENGRKIITAIIFAAVIIRRMMNEQFRTRGPIRLEEEEEEATSTICVQVLCCYASHSLFRSDSAKASSRSSSPDDGPFVFVVGVSRKMSEQNVVLAVSFNVSLSSITIAVSHFLVFAFLLPAHCTCPTRPTRVAPFGPFCFRLGEKRSSERRRLSFPDSSVCQLQFEFCLLAANHQRSKRLHKSNERSMSIAAGCLFAKLERVI